MKKNINPSDAIKDNSYVQKGVEEYFSKTNDRRNNQIYKFSKKNENLENKQKNLKKLINDKFYQKKFEKTPEKIDLTKFSKRKIQDEILIIKADKNNLLIVKNNDENISNGKHTSIEEYSKKGYNLLKLNKNNTRSASVEPIGDTNSKNIFAKNEVKNFFDINKSKSPIIIPRNNFTSFEILNLNEKNFNEYNKDKNNQSKNSNYFSSDDEILAYGTPTKLALNNNLRKRSKDNCDNYEQKLKNNSNLNLLSVLKQMKK